MNQEGKKKTATLSPIIIITLLLLAATPLVVAEETRPSIACDNNTLTYITTVEANISDTRRTLFCMLTITILDNSTVMVELAPLPIEQFQLHLLESVKQREFLPRGNMTAGEYKEYLIDQILNNATFLEQQYNEYLNLVIKSQACNYSETFMLDKSNYAEGIGFFPLYSVFDPLPYIIEGLRPVYMGQPLFTAGLSELWRDDESRGYYAIVEFAETSLYFKRNYLVEGVNIILPGSERGQVRIGAINPTSETWTFIDKCVRDYSLEEFRPPLTYYLRQKLLLIIVLLAMLGAVIGYRVLRR